MYRRLNRWYRRQESLSSVICGVVYGDYEEERRLEVEAVEMESSRVGRCDRIGEERPDSSNGVLF